MTFEDFPQDLALEAFSSKELKLYATTFFEKKSERLAELINRVSVDLEINPSELDLSENSLKLLEKWFVSQVEFVKLTKKEYEQKRSSIPDYIKIEDVKFSSNTFSLIFDVGIYFGETFIRKYPFLKWEQYFKKTVDYGHMVIVVGKLPMNPFRLLSVVCWKILHKNKDISFTELFRIRESKMEL